MSIRVYGQIHTNSRICFIERLSQIEYQIPRTFGINWKFLIQSFFQDRLIFELVESCDQEISFPFDALVEIIVELLLIATQFS